MDAYRVPAAVAEVEDVVRRSRFVTRAGRAASRVEAVRFVRETRQRFPGATHYCWAYNAGQPGSTAQVGMSDAGEPHGTAGRPMLHTLLHSGVGEVVVVCARYYGGVKLGTGGLARAYAAGVKHVLQVCPTVEKVERRAVVVTVAYDAVRRVDRVLEDFGATVNERTFGADVHYRILVPSHHLEDLAPAIAEVTGGRGRVAADNTTA
ncbi:MAG: YigZ family protein [Gemmatimonadota bacterium]|nr:YigZ family protein [Gemmatimonadota bacterium]